MEKIILDPLGMFIGILTSEEFDLKKSKLNLSSQSKIAKNTDRGSLRGHNVGCWKRENTRRSP